MSKKSQPICYKYNEDYIEELPYFTYEIDIYNESPNKVNLLSNKMYISDKLLNFKEMTIIKKFKNCKIVRYISLLGAPDWFVKELPIYKKHKRKHERKSTISH